MKLQLSNNKIVECANEKEAIQIICEEYGVQTFQVKKHSETSFSIHNKLGGMFAIPAEIIEQ